MICSEKFAKVIATVLDFNWGEALDRKLGGDETPQLTASSNDGYYQASTVDGPQEGAVNLVYEDLPSVDDSGCCSSANPYVPIEIAPVVLVMDIFMPGVGTIVAAYYDASGCNCKTITCGVFQMILTPILVGWIWSIIQGACIYKKSKEFAASKLNA